MEEPEVNLCQTYQGERQELQSATANSGQMRHSTPRRPLFYGILLPEIRLMDVWSRPRRRLPQCDRQRGAASRRATSQRGTSQPGHENAWTAVTLPAKVPERLPVDPSGVCSTHTQTQNQTVFKSYNPFRWKFRPVSGWVTEFLNLRRNSL